MEEKVLSTGNEGSIQLKVLNVTMETTVAEQEDLSDK